MMLDRRWLQRMYGDLLMSDRAIAELLGCPQYRVYHARRRLGIASRPRGHNLTGNLRLPTVRIAGRRHSPETRRKIARAVSKPCPARRGRRNGMYGCMEEDNPNWQGGRSPERQRIYSWAEWKAIVARVRERDGWKCRRCSSGANLTTHHVWPWEGYPALRFDEDNLVTICRKCSSWIHSLANVDGGWLRGGEQRMISREEGEVGC